MAKTGGHFRKPEGRRLLAPSRRLPKPANDNPHPAGRLRLIIVAAGVSFALALLALYTQIS